MSKGSFFTPFDEMISTKGLVMYDQEGLYMCWETDADAIKKIVPPDLTPLAPVAYAYAINIQNPTFASRYNEAALAIPCAYEGEQGRIEGLYWLQYLLTGPGAEMATFGGREVIGIPKKLADVIHIERNRNQASAYVERKGVRLLEITADICGSFNDEEKATAILGNPQPGDLVIQPEFYYRFFIEQLPSSVVNYFGASLSVMDFDTTYHSFEKGTAEISLGDSYLDPWAELPVNRVLGAAWAHDDAAMLRARKLEEYEAYEILPYTVCNRFDKGLVGGVEKSFE